MRQKVVRCMCAVAGIDQELRGVLPLEAGDLYITTGYFQKYLQHKTLGSSDFVKSDILNRYPGTSEESKTMLARLQAQEYASQYPDDRSDRGSFTWRRITKHKTCPRCPALPDQASQPWPTPPARVTQPPVPCPPLDPPPSPTASLARFITAPPWELRQLRLSSLLAFKHCLLQLAIHHALV